jgi:uncharacterized membrane protein
VFARALVLAAFAWPILIGTAVWSQQERAHAPVWVGVLYTAASRICHQRPERSFFTGTVQWPVCARCSGLYLGAPIGALLALRMRRRRFPGPKGPVLLAIAAVPTLITVALEWLHVAPVSNLMRAVAAAPLGLAIAWVLVRVVQPARSDGVH